MNSSCKKDRKLLRHASWKSFREKHTVMDRAEARREWRHTEGMA